MDPASVAGLIVLAGQIAQSCFQYISDVQNARREIDQLCIDLFALKGTLEHVRLHIESCKLIDDDVDSSSSFSLPSQVFQTVEFNGMLSSTDTLLRDLYGTLDKTRDRKRNIMQHLMWPFTKKQMQDYTNRLEKMKSYFILAITSDNLEVSKQMFFEVHALGQIIRTQQEEHQEKTEDERRKTVLKWLEPYDPTELHRKALDARQIGTGHWFLSRPFQQWVRGERPRVLWLRGRPGVGKTSLASAAIEELRSQKYLENDQIAVASFYCSFTDRLSQNPRNVLGSLTAQIIQVCKTRPALWFEIEERHQSLSTSKQDSAKSLDLSTLQEIFGDICDSFQTVFLFVDAPNESSESERLVSTLLDLVREHSGVRLMMSSTEEVVLSPWDSDEDLISTVAMSSTETKQDIHDYVDTKLRQDPRLQQLPTKLKDDIKATLLNKSDGIFRWVQCQLDTLVDQRTPKAIRKSLENIPQSLEKTYRDILLRIPRSDQATAKRVLLWLTFAVRILQLDELCEAVIIEDDSTTIDSEDRLLRPTDLLRICSSLISFNPSTNHVTLAHSSVQAYLSSSEIKDSPASYFFLDPSTAQSDVIRNCLTYLCFDDFRQGYSKELEPLADLASQWPLLDYAVGSWPAHARAVLTDDNELDQELKTSLLRFFATSREAHSGNFGMWIGQYIPQADQRVVRSPPLYYAARFGLVPVVKMILAVEGTTNLETVGGRRDSTPLHVASHYGHTEVCRILLDAGASPRFVNARGRTGLLTAAENGETEIVRMLLAGGADPDHRTVGGRTALYLAIVNFEHLCAQILIEAGADTKNLDGAGTSVEELQEFAKWVMPDATPGQIRHRREPDPKGGTNPRARGEGFETEQARRSRRKMGNYLLRFSQAKRQRETRSKSLAATNSTEDTGALETSTNTEGNPDRPPGIDILSLPSHPKRRERNRIMFPEVANSNGDKGPLESIPDTEGQTDQSPEVLADLRNLWS